MATEGFRARNDLIRPPEISGGLTEISFSGIVKRDNPDDSDIVVEETRFIGRFHVCHVHVE